MPHSIEPTTFEQTPIVVLYMHIKKTCNNLSCLHKKKQMSSQVWKNPIKTKNTKIWHQRKGKTNSNVKHIRECFIFNQKIIKTKKQNYFKNNNKGPKTFKTSKVKTGDLFKSAVTLEDIQQPTIREQKINQFLKKTNKNQKIITQRIHT